MHQINNRVFEKVKVAWSWLGEGLYVRAGELSMRSYLSRDLEEVRGQATGYLGGRSR